MPRFLAKPPRCDAYMQRAHRVCDKPAYFVVRRSFLVETTVMHCKRHVPWLTVAGGQAQVTDIRGGKV